MFGKGRRKSVNFNSTESWGKCSFETKHTQIKQHTYLLSTWPNLELLFPHFLVTFWVLLEIIWPLSMMFQVVRHLRTTFPFVLLLWLVQINLQFAIRILFF